MVISNNNIKKTLEAWKAIDKKKKIVLQNYQKNIISGKINEPLVNIISNKNKINLQSIKENNIIQNIKAKRELIEKENEIFEKLNGKTSEKKKVEQAKAEQAKAEQAKDESSIVESKPVLPKEIQSIKDSLTCYINYLIKEFDRSQNKGITFYGRKPNPNLMNKLSPKMFLGATDNLYRILGLKPFDSIEKVEKQKPSKSMFKSFIDYYKKLIAYTILTDLNMSYYYDQYFYFIWLKVKNEKNDFIKKYNSKQKSWTYEMNKLKKEIMNLLYTHELDTGILTLDYDKKKTGLSDIKNKINNLLPSCTKFYNSDHKKYRKCVDDEIVQIYDLLAIIRMWSSWEIYNNILPYTSTVDYVDNCISIEGEKKNFLDEILNKRFEYGFLNIYSHFNKESFTFFYKYGEYYKYLINFLNCIFGGKFNGIEYNFYFDPKKNVFFYKFGENRFLLNDLFQKNFFKELGLKNGEDNLEKIIKQDPNDPEKNFKQDTNKNFEKYFFEKQVMFEIIKDDSMRMIYNLMNNLSLQKNREEEINQLNIYIEKLLKNISYGYNSFSDDLLKGIENGKYPDVLNKIINNYCKNLNNVSQETFCKLYVYKNLLEFIKKYKLFLSIKRYLPVNDLLESSNIELLFKDRISISKTSSIEIDHYKILQTSGTEFIENLENIIRILDEETLFNINEMSILNYMNFIGKDKDFIFNINKYSYKGTEYNEKILLKNFYEILGLDSFSSANDIQSSEFKNSNKSEKDKLLWEIIKKTLLDNNIKYIYDKYLFSRMNIFEQNKFDKNYVKEQKEYVINTNEFENHVNKYLDLLKNKNNKTSVIDFLEKEQNDFNKTFDEISKKYCDEDNYICRKKFINTVLDYLSNKISLDKIKLKLPSTDIDINKFLNYVKLENFYLKNKNKNYFQIFKNLLTNYGNLKEYKKNIFDKEFGVKKSEFSNELSKKLNLVSTNPKYIYSTFGKNKENSYENQLNAYGTISKNLKNKKEKLFNNNPTNNNKNIIKKYETLQENSKKIIEIIKFYKSYKNKNATLLNSFNNNFLNSINGFELFNTKKNSEYNFTQDNKNFINKITKKDISNKIKELYESVKLEQEAVKLLQDEKWNNLDELLLGKNFSETEKIYNSSIEELEKYLGTSSNELIKGIIVLLKNKFETIKNAVEQIIESKIIKLESNIRTVTDKKYDSSMLNQINNNIETTKKDRQNFINKVGNTTTIFKNKKDKTTKLFTELQNIYIKHKIDILNKHFNTTKRGLISDLRKFKKAKNILNKNKINNKNKNNPS